MALSDITAVTVEMDVLTSEFKDFKNKQGESVSFYQVIGFIQDELVVINTLHPSAESIKSGDVATVRIVHAGYTPIRLPKFKLVEVLDGPAK